MPGIAGIVGPLPTEECRQLLPIMLGSMSHKGEYTAGAHSFPTIGVHAGWVAHGESFAARQCRHRAHSGALVLLAGECFHSGGGNGPFAKSGVPSQKEDVDVLLDLYASKGNDFAVRLNGLFSGLLIDPTERRALLFNDRYGMERIYYYEKNDTTFFASEAKALLSVLPELRSLDDRAVAEFFAYGSTLGGQTLFRNVKLLPGGSLWVFDGTPPMVKSRYFHPREWEEQPELSAEKFESEFETTFRSVLPAYLSSRTQIGISLTGGLDTRMIMACMGRTERKPVCYTYGGLVGKTLDAQIASRVARTCGLDHQILRVSRDFLKNYDQYVDRTVFVTDGSAGALGAHEIYFSALARELSPVRLTGNFGSEVLRSVSTFKPIGLSSHFLRKDFGEIVNARVIEVLSEGVHPVTHAAFREIPWHLFGTVAAARSEVTFRTPYLDNDLVKLAFRAPRSVRESARTALKLVNNCSPILGSIPTDRGLVSVGPRSRTALRSLFCEITFKLDYLHYEGLPHHLSFLNRLIASLSGIGLLDLHKFLPYRQWFRKDLAEYVRDRIASVQSQCLPYWDTNILETIATNHIRGRTNYVREINAILTLEAVARLLLRSPFSGGNTPVIVESH